MVFTVSKFVLVRDCIDLRIELIDVRADARASAFDARIDLGDDGDRRDSRQMAVLRISARKSVMVWMRNSTHLRNPGSE